MKSMMWRLSLQSERHGANSSQRSPVLSRPKSDDDSIAELGRALIRREPWAARAVMERFQPSVQRLLSRMLGAGNDVEDVSQEVFLRLFTRIDTLEEPAALRGYLHAIAVRVGCWELRRRAVRRAVLLSDSGILPEPEQPLVEDDLRAELYLLGELLEQLGTFERRAFVLRRIERRTFNEIADALGVSVSTAKRKVSRVVTRVDRVLQRESRFMFHDRSEDSVPAPPLHEAESPRSYSSVA